MQIKIDNNIYDLDDGIYLGESREGVSYRFSSKVVKVIDEYPSKIYLKDADVSRLKNLDTKILDHPVAIATTVDGKYVGPVSNYVKGSGYYDFSSIKSLDFANIIKDLLADSKKYSSVKYLIGDLQYNDSIFDSSGKLHLVDSGSYMYEPNLDEGYLERENKREIDEYLLEEVIDYLLIKKGFGKKKRDIIKNKLREDSIDYGSISDMLVREVVLYDNLDEYVGSLKK